MNPIALFDLDGTLADFSGALERDLRAMHSPAEGEFVTAYNEDEDPDHLAARKRLVKAQPGWWLNLEPIHTGFAVMVMAKAAGFNCHILSKGPRRNAGAWAEKVQWCLRNAPDAPLTLAHNKSMVYGRVLVDDWPSYVDPWLKRRPRGHVLMPARPWNVGFLHERCLRFDESSQSMEAVAEVLRHQFERKVEVTP